MEKKVKRRRFPIVDRAIQYKFLSIILSYGLIMVLLLGLVLFIPDVIAVNNEELSPEIRGAAANRILTLHARVWPAIIALVCILGIHSFRVFLRVVGPLYRFRWAFTKMKEGELNFRIKLRKGDYLFREQDLFNEMMDTLTDKLGSMQSAGQDATKSLEQLTAEMGGEQGRYKQLLKTHSQHLANMLNQARSFQLSGELSEEQETSEESA